jgi:hypothetical protein
MATLEQQYSDYKRENPTSIYTFDEWKDKVFHLMLEQFMKQHRIHIDEESKIWDQTLMDGLDEHPYDEE